MLGPRSRWARYDDEALPALAAMTPADLRSGDPKRQRGAREQLRELQTELCRRGVWRDKKDPSGGSQTPTDAAHV
jgi:hypothetical protein